MVRKDKKGQKNELNRKIQKSQKASIKSCKKLAAVGLLASSAKAEAVKPQEKTSDRKTETVRTVENKDIKEPAKFEVTKYDNKCIKIKEFDKNGLKKTLIEEGPENTVYVTSYLPNGTKDPNGVNGCKDISADKLYNDYVLKSKSIDTKSLAELDFDKRDLIIRKKTEALGISPAKLPSVDLNTLVDCKEVPDHLMYYIEHNLKGNSPSDSWKNIHKKRLEEMTGIKFDTNSKKLPLQDPRLPSGTRRRGR